MTFKSTLCKLWLKQIRMRFARFYECYDCEKRYRLTDKRDECTHCETKAICLWDEQGAESERIDCESDIKNNGECTSCGYRNPLYFQPIALSVLYKHAKWFMQDHFDINRYDQWIGHSYSTSRGNYHDTGEPFVMISHRICIIPCIGFEFTRYRDER